MIPIDELDASESETKTKGGNDREFEDEDEEEAFGRGNEKIDLTNIKSYVFVRNPYNAVASHFFHRLYFIDKNFQWNDLIKNEIKIITQMKVIYLKEKMMKMSGT